MAESSGCTETRQSAFRKLISEISDRLQPDEVDKCWFLRNVPRDRASTALGTLGYLLQVGKFSHSNVEPLAKLLRDINRHDLVEDMVESYRREYHDGRAQSLPNSDTSWPILPIKEELLSSNTSIPTTCAVSVEEESEPVDSRTRPHLHQPQKQRSQSVRQMPSNPIDLPIPRVSQGFELCYHASPVKPTSEKSRGPSALASAPCSTGDLEDSPSVEHSRLSKRGMHRLNNMPQAHASTLPRTNSYPRSARENVNFSSRGTSLSTSRTSMPGVFGEATSSHRQGSLPSGRSDTSFGRLQTTPGEQAGDDYEVFSQNHSSLAQCEGVDTIPQHADYGTPTLFRKRFGLRKRLMSKVGGSRDRSSSVVTWSIKRKKLNKAIYGHKKEKLFEFPRRLELETGGKHPPRLTLYLHPYGYEEDAQENLTLAVSLDISVKCLIPSSAMIRVEVVAKDSSSGEELKRGFIDCSADCRVARCKSFLSHRQLRELECESIDFVASAKLYNAGLTD